MNFENILVDIKNANDYLDVYDALANIEDSKLYNELYNMVYSCELDNCSISAIYTKVKKMLVDDNDSSETLNIDTNSNIASLVDKINNAANDKDLLNVLDGIGKSRYNETIYENVKQLFRNNRFMKLRDKKAAIIKYLQENQNNIRLDEVKTVDTKKTTYNKSLKQFNSEQILMLLRARIGQQMLVSDLNNLLQITFGQFNNIFILYDDLSNMELDKTQKIKVVDDDYIYIVSFDIIDMVTGLVQVVSVNKENRGDISNEINSKS